MSLIGAERHPPYDRPPLSKQSLAGTGPAERARLRAERALADLGLDLRLGARAVAADPVRRLVSLDDGERVGYDEPEAAADAVLVAIGSVPATGWLAGSGVPVGDGTAGSGVVCDAFCRAGPHVWAAGDVASWWHTGLGERMRVEHRTNAGEQGMAVRTARAHLAMPTPWDTIVPPVPADQGEQA